MWRTTASTSRRRRSRSCISRRRPSRPSSSRSRSRPVATMTQEWPGASSRADGSMSKALADCLRYDRWANLTLVEACRGLTEEQLDTRASQSSRSVRELLSHIVGSELTFALRTKGRQHEGESRHVDTWPGFEVLREVAASSGDDLIAI